MRYISYGTTVIVYSFKGQYLAEARAGAEIRDKGLAGAEKNNFGSATLLVSTINPMGSGKDE